MVVATPRPLYPRRDPVPIASKTGWNPGTVWTGAENLATTGIRYPDRPARSESLYRIRYPPPYTHTRARTHAHTHTLQRLWFYNISQHYMVHYLRHLDHCIRVWLLLQAISIIHLSKFTERTRTHWGHRIRPLVHGLRNQNTTHFAGRNTAGCHGCLTN